MGLHNFIAAAPKLAMSSGRFAEEQVTGLKPCTHFPQSLYIVFRLFTADMAAAVSMV